MNTKLSDIAKKDAKLASGSKPTKQSDIAKKDAKLASGSKPKIQGKHVPGNRPFHKGKGMHGSATRGNADMSSDLSYGGKPGKVNGGKCAPNTFPGNDIEWYQRVPNLLETAKQVAFNIPHGVRLKSTNRAVPGIIALDYAPIVGYSEQNALSSRTYTNETEFYDVWASTPFNIAMRSSYSKVRSSKGGSRPYDYPDLAQMLISAATIYAYIVHLERVLRCVNKFNFENKYLGEAMVSAQGFHYDDLIKNYVTYVGRLNLLVEKAKTIAIPSGLAVLDEWLWRNSNIFKDTNTDNIKQQFIVDVPNGYYVYNEAAGDAVYHPVTIDPNAYLSMPTVLADLESAVAQLWNSETFAILMGDLRFAYKDNVVSIPQMAMDETVEPVFNLEHAIGVQNMNSIHSIFAYNGSTIYTSANAGGFKDADLITALTIHQDLRDPELNNGAVFAGPAYVADLPQTHMRGYKIYMGASTSATHTQFTQLLTAYRSAGFADWSYISMYSDVPDGEVLIYATRMKMVGSYVSGDGGTTFDDSHTSLYFQILSSSSCLWLGPRMIIEPLPSEINQRKTGYRIFSIYANNYDISFSSALLYGLSNFNIAPKAILYLLDPISAARRFCFILGDIEVGTDIANSSLANLQSVCAYSQWLIPDTLDISGFTPRVLTK